MRMPSVLLYPQAARSAHGRAHLKPLKLPLYVFLPLSEISSAENDSEKSHCHCPGAGCTGGCRAEEPVLALHGSGLCLKPAAAILVTLGNTQIPLTLLMTHTLPGYTEQQQR